MPEVEPALWTAPEGTSWSATTCGDTSSVAGSGLTAAPTVVVRRRCDVAAGSVLYHATEPVSFWHRHDMHELQYAVAGVAEMLTGQTHYLLPPLHAAWIPAGHPHNSFLRDVTTIAVFFDPAVHAFAPVGPAILAVPPVLREMVRYASRWPAWREEEDAEATAYFAALAGVIRQQLDHRVDRSLPVAQDPIVRRVVDYTTTNLATATMSAACTAVGLSERSLRRRFAQEMGQSWRDYLRRARLFRAMALLGELRMSVEEVAAATGFASASALARSFRTWTGESPREYRRRIASARGEG